MVVPLYLVHGLENNTMFSECVYAHSPDYMILMCNTGYAVIKWGITLTFSCILTLNQDTNNWLDCMEFSSGLIKARKWGLVDFIKVSSGQINLVIWVNFFSWHEIIKCSFFKGRLIFFFLNKCKTRRRTHQWEEIVIIKYNTCIKTFMTHWWSHFEWQVF